MISNPAHSYQPTSLPYTTESIPTSTSLSDVSNDAVGDAHDHVHVSSTLLSSSSSPMRTESVEETNTHHPTLPWSVDSVGYQEFRNVQTLCEQSPFVFMRKDNLLVYYKCHYPQGFSFLSTAQAYQHLPETKVWVFNQLHFISFQWKFKALQRRPPTLPVRLRYLTFPSTYPIAMLQAMYTAVYGPISKKEFYHACCQAFGKPITCTKDTSTVKVTIPHDLFKDTTTWATLLSQSASVDAVKEDYIPLDTVSESETVYSSESESESVSSVAATTPLPPSSSSWRIGHPSKRLSSATLHTPISKRTKPVSKPHRLPAAASTAARIHLLSTHCSMRSRDLLLLLRDFLLSTDYLPLHRKTANGHLATMGSLGKDLSRIIEVSAQHSYTTRASTFF